MPQLLNYLQLQPVEPDDDGTSSSPLDDYQHDDSIDLSQDEDGEALRLAWEHILEDSETDAKSSTQTDQ